MLYVQLMDLKVYLEICIPVVDFYWTFKVVGQSKLKVVVHENDTNGKHFSILEWLINAINFQSTVNL